MINVMNLSYIQSNILRPLHELFFVQEQGENTLKNGVYISK